MARWQILAAGLGIAAATVVVAQAADPAFNVRPGLWQMRSSGTTTGALPIPPEMLARMSPEQRARVEAAMRAAIAHGNAGTETKSCVTSEQLRQGPVFGNREGCTHAVIKRTSTELQIHEECAGQQRRLDMHVRALTPEKVAGTVDATISERGRTLTVHRQLSGSWLGADCGDVKPGGH